MALWRPRIGPKLQEGKGCNRDWKNQNPIKPIGFEPGRRLAVKPVRERAGEKVHEARREEMIRPLKLADYALRQSVTTDVDGQGQPEQPTEADKASAHDERRQQIKAE